MQAVEAGLDQPSSVLMDEEDDGAAAATFETGHPEK